VNDDVADMIAKKVHIFYQKKLNNEIHVMVGGDVSFDYLQFDKFRSNNLFFPYNLRSGIISSIPRVCENIYYAIGKLRGFFKNIKNKSQKISQKDYAMYMLSNKQVFRLDRPVRWNNLLCSLEYFFNDIKDDLFNRPINNRWNFEEGITELSNKINQTYYEKISKVEGKNINIENVLVYWMSFPIKKKNIILKKDLINYLVANGYCFKSNAFRYTKSQLWNLVMKME
jgi:hypothetical protein